jgi:hypothetical protein
MRSIDPSCARASEVQEWLVRAEADVLVVGHSHQALELRGARGELVANPGTLLRSEAWLIPGRAMERRTRPSGGGTFAVLEVPSLRYRVFDCRDGRERTYRCVVRPCLSPTVAVSMKSPALDEHARSLTQNHARVVEGLLVASPG